MKVFNIGIEFEYMDDTCEIHEETTSRYVIANTIEEAFAYVKEHIEDCFAMEVRNPKVIENVYMMCNMDEIGLLRDKSEFVFIEGED